MTVANSDNRYSCNGYIVAPTIAEGANYTTIASAVAAAPAGSTIFIKPGTYTEDITITKSVNLVSFAVNGYDNTAQVTIAGKFTLATNSVNFRCENICFNTNADVCFSVTADPINMQFVNCTLYASNANLFSVTTSNLSNIAFKECAFNTANTYTIFTNTSAVFWFLRCIIHGSDGSTASTLTDGQVKLYQTHFRAPISINGTGTLTAVNSYIVTVNTTFLTTAGTTNYSTISCCDINTGTASALSIGSGTTVQCSLTNISSSNSNAIDGAGTLNYSNLSFSNTSQKINVTTQTGGVSKGGVFQAPSAGFIGQQIRSAIASAAAVSITNNTYNAITSISLTAGVWDVSFIAIFNAAATTSITQLDAGISTSALGLSEAPGDGGARIVYNVANVGKGECVSVPSYRVTLTATTTYYLGIYVSFTVSTLTAYGRISATRVG